MREIYLDNSATTKVFPEVAELAAKVMTEDYGNPSSMHRKGIDAEKYVKEAAERLATVMKVDPKELIFTSCGTESDNLALIGCAMANRRAGNHIITTVIEHPAILNTVAYLEEQGFRVTRLGVDEQGLVRPEEFEAAICPETILASVMYVNNEIGSRQPVEELAKILHKKNPGALFHTDAVQAFGKYKIYPARAGIDLVSISGHKIHAPKGIGVLYVRKGVKIKPVLFGGGQQNGMRSGTHNVPSMAGIGLAAKMLYKNFDEDIAKLYELKQMFADGLERIPGCHINGQPVLEGAPHIVSVSFDEIERSEVLLHALEEKGIYVSSGSACSTNHPGISATLSGIGLDRKYLGATLRFSFSVFTTKEDIEETLAALEELLPIYRKLHRH